MVTGSDGVSRIKDDPEGITFLLEKLAHGFRSFALIDTQDFQGTVLEFSVERLQGWHRHAARPAPGCPEVKHNNLLSTKRRQSDVLVGDVMSGEFGGGCSHFRGAEVVDFIAIPEPYDFDFVVNPDTSDQKQQRDEPPYLFLCDHCFARE